MRYIIEFDEDETVVLVLDDMSVKRFTYSEYSIIKDILPMFTDDSIKRFTKITKKNK